MTSAPAGGAATDGRDCGRLSLLMSIVDVDRVVAGRYRLTSLLNRSRGLETYVAQDEQAGDAGSRAVVLKLASVRTLPEPARRRLAHEHLVLERLDHPNLAPLLDRGTEGDLLYLVTPWVPGRSLAARLGDGPLPVLDAVRVARDVVAALCHAHEHGVLHRDVKPANVVTSGDRAVLVDCGLARSALLDAQLRDVPIGSVRYLAPEQAGLLPGPVDERSDLYAVGLTIIECLRAAPVFDGAQVSDVLRQQMTSSPPRIGPPAPAVLGQIVDRLVRRDPAERYQTAAALLFDLEALLEKLASGDSEPTFAVGSRDRRETLAEPTFVGREAELALLQDSLQAAIAGDGGVVTVGAASGRGKSRLLAELTRRVGDDVRVLHGQGLDHAAQRPFQVLSGVVRGVARAATDDQALATQLREHLDGHADAVAVAFPELAPVLGVGGRSAVGPEEFGEVRTVRGLAALLDGIGTPERPAMVLLDDCQWADELSGRLLTRWNETRRRPCHVLVLTAYRTDELPPESAIRRIDARADVSLPPLTDRDVQALAESMAGSLPAPVLETTARLAEGSPFMAAAVLRGLFEAGALVSGPDGWEVEPSALADARSSRRAATVLSHRITLLGDDVRRLLSVGAVLGKEFEIAVAAVLAEADPVDVGRAVREASRRHLVWPVDGGRCAFVHDKIRETLLALIDDDERRELHRRTALLLEERAPTRFFDLAYHFDAADQPDRALPYALAAADEARAMQSLEVVEEQYRIAQRGADDAQTRGTIAEELGRVLMLRGRYEEAAERLEAARTLAQDPVVLARIDGSLGELAFKRGDMTTSAIALERALRTLDQRMPRRGWVCFALWEVLVQAVHSVFPRLIGRRPLDDHRVDGQLLSARLYSRLAHTYWFQRGSVATMFAHLRGMNLSERYPPTPQRAQAYSEHAPGMSLLPWYRRGTDYAERSLAIRRDLGDLWGQGQSLHFYGVVLYAASRWEECIERCREAIRLLDRTGDRWEVNTARWHVAYASYRLGDLTAAAELGEQVWRDGIELGDPQASGIGLAVWSKATGGRVPAGATGPELEQLSDDVHTAAEVLSAEAIRLLAEDRPAESVQLLERADCLVRDAGLRQEYVAPVPAWLLTALRVEREGAGDHLDLRQRRTRLRRARRIGRRARRLGRLYRNNLPHALREAALVEAALGRRRRARRWLDRSVAAADQLGARQEHALSRLARGEVGRVLGWPDADEDVRVATATLEEISVRSADDEMLITVSLADRFDSLLSAGRAIASSLSVEGAFLALAEAAETLLRPQQCVVLATPGLERDPRPDAMVAVAGAGTDFPPEMLEEALAGDHAVVLDELVDPDARDSIVRSGVRSLLCAPVQVRGETVACLCVGHGDGGMFGEDEIRIAGYVTALAGAALENAEGFAEIEALTRTLEQRVVERTAELTDANRQLDRRVSELRDAYDREQEIAEQLRKLDQFKTEMVAITAHDLRTPLAIIMGFASTLHDQEDRFDPDERRGLLLRILSNARRLSEFVENLLQFARIESGELHVDVLPFDLEALIRRTVAEFEASDPARPFDVEVDPDLPTVVGDESRQWQILMNLLSNAVKYSAPGAPVSVHVRPGDAAVTVSVRDAGDGIPATELPRVFSKFSRIGPADGARKAMGTGLGLYISRSLVEAQGGEIHVTSSVGVGTTFTYSIPVQQGDDTEHDTGPTVT